MLVIDRIKLVVLDETLQMGELKRCDTIWGKEMGYTRREVVEIWYLRKYVVSDDEIGPAAFRFQAPSNGQTEEFNESGNVFCRATSAILAAGSIPMTGMPSGRKC